MRKPECECFTGDNAIGVIKSGVAARRTAEALLANMRDCGLCKDALAHTMELTVISMAAAVALYGTAIDPFSQEAEWEVDRVLTGIEDRVRGAVREMRDNRIASEKSRSGA